MKDYSSDYGDQLRSERRLELTRKILSPEMVNEYGEISFATKTEDGKAFPSGDYAYVPDVDKPSTWKLRLTSVPGGSPDPRIVGAAIAALGKGFRGNKVQIPSEDLAAVKIKVKAAWKKANPDKDEADIPSVIASGLTACGDHDDRFKFNLKVNNYSASPPPELWDAISTLKDLARASLSGYDLSFYFDIKVDENAEEDISTDFSVKVSGISQTPSDVLILAYESFVSAVKTLYGSKIEIEVSIKAKAYEIIAEPEPVEAEVSDDAVASSDHMPAYYGTDGVEELVGEDAEELIEESSVEFSSEELAGLPPALKAQLVKKLEGQLAKETDPEKKAALQEKIDKYKA